MVQAIQEQAKADEERADFNGEARHGAPSQRGLVRAFDRFDSRAGIVGEQDRLALRFSAESV
jgi:hypothetical protein